MGRLGCPIKGGNWVGELGGFYLLVHRFDASPSVGFQPSRKLWVPLSVHWLQTTYWKKKVFLIIFRQILPKIWSVVHIFSNTVTTYLKNFIGNESLNTKQCPAGLHLRITPLNFYGKHWGWRRIQANSKNLLISPTRKILLNKFTSSTIKSFVPSPSNSNLHLITLYKLHL